MILDAAPGILGKGNATVINQHHSLRRAYDYFPERAQKPAHIEDELKTGKSFTGDVAECPRFSCVVSPYQAGDTA